MTYMHIPDGRIDVNGTPHMRDSQGRLTPVGMIKPQYQLEDETVRKIISYAEELSEQIARFKAHTFDDIGYFEAVLAQEYGATKGGTKGNKTLASFDGLLKVQVQVADHIDFGPELQIAKELVDECLIEWAADSRDEIRAVVSHAFHSEKVGQINKNALFALLRLDIGDARWQRAMAAIRDAIRVVGSRVYVRCYRRDRFDAQWEPIVIDLARS